jgi:hypothetical protein
MAAEAAPCSTTNKSPSALGFGWMSEHQRRALVQLLSDEGLAAPTASSCLSLPGAGCTAAVDRSRRAIRTLIVTPPLSNSS